MAIARSVDRLRGLAEILEDLGGIAPARVRMKRPFGPITESDLIDANERGKTLFELVDGLLVEKGMGFDESGLALALAGFLRACVLNRNLCLISEADGMMRLLSGVVRVPDLAYIS